MFMKAIIQPILLSILMAGVLIGVSPPVHATDDAMLELFKILRDKGSLSQQEYDLLVNTAEAGEKQEDTADEVKKKIAAMPKITTKGKFKIEGDGWSFQPIGRVMWDSINVDNDVLHSDDTGEGTELRRARLGMQGTIGAHWSYNFEGDFAKGSTSIKDAYVGYGTKFANTGFSLKVGQSHIAFGFNTKASSKYMSFLDRPLYADSTISAARESGIVAQLAAKDYRWAITTSLTKGGISSGKTGNDNATTFATRGSFIPFKKDATHMLQVGAAYLNQSSGDGSFSYKQRLVSHIGPKDISTSVADYDGSDAFTVDALGIYGAFHALAEYVDWQASSNSSTDQNFTGYSFEAGYFLTGESVKWKNGYTSGIKPKSKLGAWQLAARFENMETDGPTGSLDDKAEKFTIGVNYYPTQNTRLMLNYDKVTSLSQAGLSSDEKPSAFKFRAQVYW